MRNVFSKKKARYAAAPCTVLTSEKAKRKINRKLKIMVFSLLAFLLAFDAFFCVLNVISINRNCYTFMKAIAEEEVVAFDSEFDVALRAVQGYAKIISEGFDLNNYLQYTTFDQAFYIDAKSEEANRLRDTNIIYLGLKGKSGVEVDFEKLLYPEVTLAFYAPVTQRGEVVGVVVGLFTQENVSQKIKTDCYETTNVSFFTNVNGDIIFSTPGEERYIGRNVFTDFHQKGELISTSLDNLPQENYTFANLKNVLFNNGDFSFTCKDGGEYEITCVEALNHDGFAITETFPPSVLQEMVDSQIRASLLMGIFIILFMLFFVAPLVQKYGKSQLDRVTASQIEAENSAKSDFLSKMSHDMRTPLNGILGMTEIALQNNNDINKMQDCLKKIKKSGNYLLSLINEVLDLNAIEAGKIEIKEEPTNLNEIVEREKAIVDNFLAGKALAVSYLNTIEYPNVFADALSMQKISINLLSNAVKYTPAGGSITAKFWDAEAEEPGYRWYFTSVQDTGVGMSPEFMKRMFVPYEREEDVRVSKTQGTGLGLPIVKALVEGMGGTISVESKEGCGSTFTVKLRLKLAQESDFAQAGEGSAAESGAGAAAGTGAGAAAESGAGAAAGTGAGAAATASSAGSAGAAKAAASPAAAGAPLPQKLSDIDCIGYRCLLVDDNDLNLEIAHELLALTGIAIEEATNGKMALNKYRNAPKCYYDLIFMDIQMPVMDGYTATQEIRKSNCPDAATIPIIAMTANAYEKDAQDARNAGMNEHVPKPIEQEKLVAVLMKYLKVRVK